jgi:hypothetical protein
MIGLLFDPEYGDDMLPQNIRWLSTRCVALCSEGSVHFMWVKNCYTLDFSKIIKPYVLYTLVLRNKLCTLMLGGSSLSTTHRNKWLFPWLRFKSLQIQIHIFYSHILQSNCRVTEKYNHRLVHWNMLRNYLKVLHFDDTLIYWIQ